MKINVRLSKEILTKSGGPEWRLPKKMKTTRKKKKSDQRLS